ncbi:uncharacterized protein LOC103504930 isoform X1 [Diaphorina citri]|uniref:Uncharacterized protein LOC103504930 isoform X1 n=1 Tax=Diaphorina citri TaxID=121845 RepID=A0A1S3CUS3_DIACI|nr:uncharacterized protein LOC103504930 isoform X1 [Diaphorina citri]
MLLGRSVWRIHSCTKHALVTARGDPNPIRCWRRAYTSRVKLEQFAKMSFVDYPPKPSGIPGIVLQRSGPQHLSQVQNLLRESFFKDEPLVTALGLAGKTDPDFIDEEAKLVLEQLSLLAIDERSDQIVAAAINRTVLPQEMTDWPKEIDQMKCPQTQKLARLWYTLSTKPNIFTTFKVATYFELTFLVTTKAARGKGLAQLLAQQSLLLARESQVPLAVIYCTNVASARIAEKLSMKLIGVHSIRDYIIRNEDFRNGAKTSTSLNDQISVYAITLGENMAGRQHLLSELVTQTRPDLESEK